MPMSSPMMTTMFGFLSAAVAGAAAPMSAASTAAEMLAITFDWNRTFMDSSSCSLFSRAAGSRRCPSRRRRPRRPGRQPIGELPGPRLHGVLGIAQLPLRRRRDAAAPDALVYAGREDLAGHRVDYLPLGLRRADEGIGARGGVLQRGECPRLGNEHRHRPEDGDGLADVVDGDLDLHDAGSGLVDDLELLRQRIVERLGEVVRQRQLIGLGHLRVVTTPEADRSDDDLLVLGPPGVGVEVAEAHHRVPSAADGCGREATGGGARCQLRADVTPEKWTVHLGFVGDLHLLRRRTAPEDCDRPQAGDADGKTIAPLLLDYDDPHSRLPS